MKYLPLVAALVLPVSAFAQTTPPAQTPPAQTAPATPNRDATTAPRGITVNGKALENGSNSFTHDQAMARLRDAGISEVSQLTLDQNGIWRGRGTWQGRQVAVGLDFQGNIAAQ